MSNTQATASAKGYILQSYFGIYFIFKDKNYKKIKDIKIEAKEEDIVITYKDGSKDFIQVKTTENPNDKKFDNTVFKKGMGTLKKAFEKSEQNDIIVDRLIYAHNLIDQKNLRLTNRIKNGDEVNFIYNFVKTFSKEELLKFSKSLKFEIHEKYYLSRIDESYLIGNSGKFFNAIKQLYDTLNIDNGKGLNIYDKLKIYFIENACKRNQTVTVNEIALVFLKEKIAYDKLYGNFDKYYEEEIDELGYEDIRNLIDENYNGCILSKISDYFRVNLYFFDIEIDFKNLNPMTRVNINNSNRKDFIEFGYDKFMKKNYICFENNISKEVEEMIYKFLIGFEIEKDLGKLSSENDFLDKEIRKINILEGIKKYTEDYSEKEEINLNPLIGDLENLEIEKLNITNQLHIKRLELKESNQIIDENISFAEKIEMFHIVINYKGEDIRLKKELLKGFNTQTDVLNMKKNELELEIKILESKRSNISRKINKISFSEKNKNLIHLETMFSKLNELEIPWGKIEGLKKINKEAKKENDEKISNGIEKLSTEFWRILEKVLKDIKLSNEYIRKDIIFTNKLSGITGTQLHKLTFSYKIALVLYIEKKLGLKLPFIIDSPRSGEVSKETASEMLNLCHKYLKNHQLIVSSVYDDYNCATCFTVKSCKGL